MRDAWSPGRWSQTAVNPRSVMGAYDNHALAPYHHLEARGTREVANHCRPTVFKYFISTFSLTFFVPAICRLGLVHKYSPGPGGVACGLT